MRRAVISRRGSLSVNSGELFERRALVERWLELTRTVLPALAARNGWPITLDHCFMRVCLDVSLGRPWRQVVRPPALRHLGDDELRAAIVVAEGIVAEPATLPMLNAESLRLRGKLR